MTDQEIREKLVIAAHRAGGYKVLAHELGISQPYLSQIVHGYRKMPARVAEYAKSLALTGCPACSTVGGQGDPMGS